MKARCSLATVCLVVSIGVVHVLDASGLQRRRAAVVTSGWTPRCNAEPTSEHLMNFEISKSRRGRHRARGHRATSRNMPVSHAAGIDFHTFTNWAVTPLLEDDSAWLVYVRFPRDLARAANAAGSRH
jgi:hypothetical protein